MASREAEDAEDFERRMSASREVTDLVCAWLREQSASRVKHRSFGDMKVEITWHDGWPTFAKVQDANTFKPRNSEENYPGR